MIQTSLFELFKIGPGPSSSHTVGPMFAANDFRNEMVDLLNEIETLQDASIQVELFGSLSDTGIGHGTHKAVAAGLMGEEAPTVNVEKLVKMFEGEDNYDIDFNGQKISFSFSDIIFIKELNPHRHPNTLKFIFANNYKIVKESLYYSIGGGFIEKDGQDNDSEDREVIHNYSTMEQFHKLIQSESKSAIQLLTENEMSISDLSAQEIHQNLDEIIDAMTESVESGLSHQGTLPGGLNVRRRSKSMFEESNEMADNGDKLNAEFFRMNAYALAVSEENAAGHLVVTAPTNGAAGIIPAAIYYLLNDCQKERSLVREGLMIAGLVGFIIKENASISGAELGCMAEVGAATSMAAAMFTYCFGGDEIKQSIAAEIALEHSLGMTCDPINGLVQVPCIERNATGIVKAYNSYILAMGRKTNPLISLDQVIKVMKETGTDLSNKYKETSSGGLAVHGWGNMPGS